MDSSLLKQIQNGKKLKHSESNDRSSPQIGKTSSTAPTSSSGANASGGGGGGGLFGNSKPMLPSQRNAQTNPRIQSTANVKQSQTTTARAAPALPARSATMVHANTRPAPATPERAYNKPQPTIPNGNRNNVQKKDSGFNFHSENEFPSPIPFSGSHKEYSTSSVKSSPSSSSSQPVSSSSRQTSSSSLVGFQPIPKQNFPKKAPPPPPPAGPKPTIKRTAPPPPR